LAIRGQWLSELLPWSAGELKARDATDEATGDLNRDFFTGVNGDVIWEDMGYIYIIQYMGYNTNHNYDKYGNI
jgi:hypothetical protein